MPVEHINPTDSLNTGRVKLNAAIDQSNEAIDKANSAVTTATHAKNRADNVQEQLNQIVIEGDSSVEAAQARVDADGNVFTTLKERLDTKEQQFTAQLAQMEMYKDQEDFVQTLKRHMKYKSLNVLPNNITDDFNVSVLYDIGDKKSILYTLNRQHNIDEYIKIGVARYGNLIEGSVVRTAELWDERTGTWNDVGSYWTSQVGATMTKSFYGNGLDFRHYADNRGGIWEFIIDGDTANPIIISTWAETAGSKTSRIFDNGDKNEYHTVVATFKGDDPNNPPSTGPGTARGWANFIENQFPFHIKVWRKTNEPILDIMSSPSNKEFAFQIRKANSGDPFHFVPYHGIKTAFWVDEPKFFVDGTAVQLEKGVPLNNIKEFKLVQSVYGRVPEHPNEDLVKITTITTFSNDGTVNVDGKMEVLTNVEIGLGYINMLPLTTNFSKLVMTGINNKYPTLKSDNSSTRMVDENDKCTSYIGLNDGNYKDLGIAMTINTPKLSLRQGEHGKSNDNAFIQHRNDGIQKVYLQTYNQASLTKGYIHRWSGTYFIARVDGLYDML